MNVQDAILYASLEQVQCLLNAVDDVQVVAWPLVMELLLCVREPSGRWRARAIFDLKEQTVEPA